MTNFLNRLFRKNGKQGATEGVDRTYVSEHTNFINHYLDDHPEVVEDQWIGREIYWDKVVDFADQRNAERDAVPEDGYGFHYSAWLRNGKVDTPRFKPQTGLPQSE